MVKFGNYKKELCSRYSQTTYYLHRSHGRQGLLLLVYSVRLVLVRFFTQGVQVTVHLHTLAGEAGLFKDQSLEMRMRKPSYSLLRLHKARGGF